MNPGTMREGEKSQRTGKAQVASERDGLGQLIREKVLQLEMGNTCIPVVDSF